MASLRDWGLPVTEDQFHEPAHGLAEIAAYHQDMRERRENLAYDVDGVVIKLDRFDLRAELTSPARAPLWAVAWKFPPRQEITTVRDIVVQVGRTGKLTPVALLDPVDVGGATVSRATLHNFGEVARLGVRQGDRVKVARAGDVIPQVVEVAEAGPFALPPLAPPRQCPVCGAAVVAEGAYHLCPNAIGCPAQIEAAIRHWAGRQAMDIEGLGPRRVAELRARGLLTDLASLYELPRHQDALAALDGWGEVSARNLVVAIEKSRGAGLDRFLFALGIPSVGAVTARHLARRFRSLSALAAATAEELAQVETVKAGMPERIRAFLSEGSASGRAARALDRAVGPLPPEEPAAAGGELPLLGRSVVFTGGLSRLSREEAESLARRAGARTSGSVSKATGLVVVGENPGAKAAKAQALGVPTVDEAGFLALLGRLAPEA